MRTRTKRDRWRENLALDRVHEPDLRSIAAGDTYLRGEWGRRVFATPRPITLELGCGQGLFAVDLARRFPERNFIGIDLKGHRFWRGARIAHDTQLTNTAFLRARIQWLDHYFAPDEVEELWLTFSDPQLGDRRGTKRLTSPYYLALYQSIMPVGGVLRVKTDSPQFYERTLIDGPATGMEIVDRCEDVHGAMAGRFGADLTTSLAFRTAFEERWIADGRSIHYVSLRKSKGVNDDELQTARRMLQGPAGGYRARYSSTGT